MAKGAKQKLKILYLRDFLRQNSNYEHPVSVADIISYLDANGISAERKSVYDDVAQLQIYGDDIAMVKGKNGGYYYDSLEFDLPEIKMLVDSVQSSKFITEKQSIDLIKKLENLTNKYEASQLQRQVVVQNRVKTAQTNIFNNIDHISGAINSDSEITFKYIKYDINKNSVFRHEGKVYRISPYCLIWDDENYYLLGYDDEQKMMKHFRVDKMKNISATDGKRTGKDVFENIDITSYNKKVFSMFQGEETKVTIRFSYNLIDVALDRFGMGTTIVPEDDGEHFTVTTDIVVSNQFYSWIFGLGGDCEVVSPEYVRDEIRSMAEKLTEQYK